jgi:exodeoxyribonuclease VII large subunit
MPREGDKVEVRALVSLYAPRGDYQINVEAIRRAGVGNLFEAFLQLKAKLASEGLFDPERKRPLPPFIRTIGIVTSPKAAALRDILTTLARRAPHVQILIYPSPVQGEGAGTKLAVAIASAAADGLCDVLLVARGGGSIEDLWAFNEEIVARTIANCSIPVISGVGHETDFTIADFVADLRAPTPTAAAELAATPRQDFIQALQLCQSRLHRQMHRQLEQEAQNLDHLSQRLLSPLAALANKRLQVQHCAQRLRFAMQVPLQAASMQVQAHSSRLTHLKPNTMSLQNQLERLRSQLKQAKRSQIQEQRSQLEQLQAKLETLNPQRTLERGYVILSDEDGALIRSGESIKLDQLLTLRTASDSTQLRIADKGKSHKT